MDECYDFVIACVSRPPISHEEADRVFGRAFAAWISLAGLILIACGGGASPVQPSQSPVTCGWA